MRTVAVDAVYECIVKKMRFLSEKSSFSTKMTPFLARNFSSQKVGKVIHLTGKISGPGRPEKLLSRVRGPLADDVWEHPASHNQKGLLFVSHARNFMCAQTQIDKPVSGCSPFSMFCNSKCMMSPN